MSKIYTIGHSTRTIDQFISKMSRYQITHIVDARTTPFSRYAPQFNRYDLKKSLEAYNFTYIYAGKSIGGLGENQGQEEMVDGLCQLANNGIRVVVMCSEADYRQCHRFSVLTPMFEARGVPVEHLGWEPLAQRPPESKENQTGLF